MFASPGMIMIFAEQVLQRGLRRLISRKKVCPFTKKGFYDEGDPAN